MLTYGFRVDTLLLLLLRRIMYIYLDSEYFESKEEFMQVVCFSVVKGDEVRSYWLSPSENNKTASILNSEGKVARKYNSEGYNEFMTLFREVESEGYTLVCFNAVAEFRALYSLGISFDRLIKIKCVDLQVEYKMLINNNNRFAYGKQYMDKVVKVTHPPEWDADPKKDYSRPKTNLESTLFKVLNILPVNVNYKESMRDLILSKDLELIEERKGEIMRYCESDTIPLPSLHKGISKKLLRIIPKSKRVLYEEESLNRGWYTAYATTYMETVGYPVDVDKVLSLSKLNAVILYKLQVEILGYFPSLFKWDKRNGRFTVNTKYLKEYIESDEGLRNRWGKTKTGYSLKEELFAKYFPYRNEFPTNILGAQYLRYLKIKKSLNGFLPPKQGKETLLDSLGTDGRVRSYLNPFGSQTSRTQPKATSFIPLKSRWTRAFIVPSKGKAIAGLDYKSEEFFVSALETEDMNMINAYLSGDVYLAFGKQSKVIPMEATKETHGKERGFLKSTVLGISYNISKVGLARKLSMDTNSIVSEDEAQKYIDKFERTYSKFTNSQEQYLDDFISRGYLRLVDGWYSFTDLDNDRSVKNFRIQGLSACIMRKAVELSLKEGLSIIYTLHDALYMEYEVGDFDKILTLKKCMVDAFIWAFKDKRVASKYSHHIGVDIETFSPEYDTQTIEYKGEKIHTSPLYFADPTAKKEYEKFTTLLVEDKDLDLF